MADIIAQLEVLSRDSGCLLDLSAIIDLGVCKKIDIKTDRPHKIEKKDDYVCVTPTGPKPKPKPTKPVHHGHYTKRCEKPGGCYEVTEAVCKKPTVVLDLELLVLLGLLTEEQLEEYMKTTGQIGEGDKVYVEDDEVTVDPLLSVQLGDNGDILNLELLGEDGLLNLDLLNDLKKRNYGSGYGSDSGSHYDNGDDEYYEDGSNSNGGGIDQLIDIDALGQTDKGKPALIDVDLLNHDRRSYSDQLLNLQVGGKDKGGKPAIIDIKALTNPSKRADRPLLDLDALGEAKDNNALIDVDLLTELLGGDKSGSGSSSPSGSTGGSPSGSGSGSGGDRPLLDLDALGDAKDNNALIDVDLLTNLLGGDKGKGSESDSGVSPVSPVRPPVKKPCKACSSKGLQKRDNYITHYQPICGKGFKKEHRDASDACHATDVNHCLSLCQSKAALATINAKVAVGDIANIQVCAAIEFNSNEAGDNCHYITGPETEPCHDDQLEPVEDCTAFVRN